jgi:hypothetical protein
LGEIINIQIQMKSYLYILIIVLLCSCDKSESTPNASASATTTGTAGSLARFAIVGDHLYVVTSTNFKIFDITSDANPVYIKDTYFASDVETIFPMGNTLFMGSQSGMYIYDITNPTNPAMQSIYRHITSCDPVVANDKFAYVTLNTLATRCARGLNQLEVIDITNKKAPQMLTAIPLTHPEGLVLNGNDLFVCDDKVRWFDTTNSPTLTQKGVIDVKAHDAIISGKTLMLVGNTGLSQYDFSGTTPKFLSEIKVGM